MAVEFEYYVLHYNCNAQKIEHYNVFWNSRVQEWTEKAIKKYVRSPKKFSYSIHTKGQTLYGFEALCRELRGIFMNQTWSRREFELSIADAFETDVNKLEKWDAFDQIEKNIPMIARECIYQYKQQTKKGKINERQKED